MFRRMDSKPALPDAELAVQVARLWPHREHESLLGTWVYLELHVKVKDRWRESQPFVEGLDWRRQLEDLE